ncbi:MAG: hypothetical protein GKR98_06730 [Boseongicola sp.]|nr:MAG: hypothetical protein GKR98_06730 [Boseongicola sp.]
MGRLFIIAVAVGAASFAYYEYTGHSILKGVQSISFGGSGPAVGAGAFAGGYGMAAGSSRSTGGSMRSMGSGIGASFGAAK